MGSTVFLLCLVPQPMSPNGVSFDRFRMVHWAPNVWGRAVHYENGKHYADIVRSRAAAAAEARHLQSDCFAQQRRAA